MRSLEKYSCKLCCKNFATYFSMNRHMLLHSREKAFKCSFCEKTFALEQYKREHEFTHTLEKPYVCGVDGCTEGFRQRGKLSLHRRTHKGYKVKRYNTASKRRSKKNRRRRRNTCFADDSSSFSSDEEEEESVHSWEVDALEEPNLKL